MLNEREKTREIGNMIIEDRLSELMDIEELCKYFNVSTRTAYALVRERDFPSLKVGGKYRIIKDDLAKWMEKKSRKSNVR